MWIKEYKHFCDKNNLKQSDIKSLEYFVIITEGTLQQNMEMFYGVGGNK